MNNLAQKIVVAAVAMTTVACLDMTSPGDTALADSDPTSSVGLVSVGNSVMARSAAG